MNVSRAWAAVTLVVLCGWGTVRADPLSDLLDAVRAGDAAKVRAAMKAGADPTDSDGTGTALEQSLRFRDVDVVRALKEGGGDYKKVERQGWNALDLLLQQPAPPEIVKIVLDTGLKVSPGISRGYSALMMYGPVHDEAMAKVLIEAGEDVSATDTKKEWSPLSLAAFGGSAGVVKLLLEHGASADQKLIGNGTALHAAARRGGAEAAKIIEMLLAAHADPNLKDRNGWTPLMYATMARSAESVDALLKGGARVDAEGGRGYRAITTAAIYGDAATIRRLVEAKAKVNVKDEQGRSPLCWALVAADPTQSSRWGQNEEGEKEAPAAMTDMLAQIDRSDPEGKVAALIAGGADVNEMDPSGWSPLMLAVYMWDGRKYQQGDQKGEGREPAHWRQGEWEKFQEKHDVLVVVKALLKAGAVRRDTGRADALEVAAQRSDGKREELLKLLRAVKVKSAD